jgi:prephenate dehydrogenase
MKIAVYGTGHVGGGLADLWERAGHRVQRLGRDGGEVSGIDVVLVSVPGNALAEAIGKLKGVQGLPLSFQESLARPGTMNTANDFPP